MLGALAVAVACARATPPDSSPLSAEVALRELEERLLTAASLRLRYRVNAEGALSAALEGELVIIDSVTAQLAAHGTFGDSSVMLRLNASEGRLRGGSRARVLDVPVPPHLKPALLLGLTRMGILHNLARLTAGRAPDRAEGGIEEWVLPRDVRWLERTENDVPGMLGLHFDIEVAGNRVSEADLWLGNQGLPVRRYQLVRFPGGEMRVVEEYTFEPLRP